MDAADNGTGSGASMAAAGRMEPEGVGAFLRARRLQLGLSHADIANVVKLPARRIDALENERWDELPDGPFLRGFLRNVARALDLNATTLMDRVDDSLMRSRNPESILVPPDVPHATLPRRSGPVDDRHGGRALVFGAFAFAVVAALIAWSGTASFDRTLAVGRGLVGSPTDGAAARPGTAAPAVRDPDATPRVDAASVAGSSPAVGDGATSNAAPTNPAASQGPTPNATTPPQQAALAATNLPAGAVSLSFHFNEQSWVEVRSADGRVLLQRLNPAGSEQEVDGEAPFSLIVGNARGVALRFRGQPVDLTPYTRDQVARLTLS